MRAALQVQRLDHSAPGLDPQSRRARIQLEERTPEIEGKGDKGLIVSLWERLIGADT